MPGNNGRLAKANANTRSGVGAPSPTPTLAGASLSSSSIVTATGPPSSSSLSFLELRHRMAVLRRDVGCARQRAATGVRRCTLAAWRKCAAAARIGARSVSTGLLRDKVRTSALFAVN